MVQPTCASGSTLRIFSNPQLNGRTITLDDGQVICDERTAADNVYYINQGQVRLYMHGSNDSTRLVEILGPGEWFGIASLAGMAMHQKSAVAVEKSIVTQVSVQRLLALLALEPAQLVELNRQLAIKLLAATEEAGRYTSEDCAQRLVGALIRFSDSAASTHREDGVILRITHNQLAQAIGVARETVSLALMQLRQRNLLRTGRNQLVFNPDSLRRMSSSAPQMHDVA